MRVGSFKINRIIKNGDNFYSFTGDKKAIGIAYLLGDSQSREPVNIEGSY